MPADSVADVLHTLRGVALVPPHRAPGSHPYQHPAYPGAAAGVGAVCGGNHAPPALRHLCGE